jgi:hypothetical protein
MGGRGGMATHESNFRFSRVPAHGAGASTRSRLLAVAVAVLVDDDARRTADLLAERQHRAPALGAVGQQHAYWLIDANWLIASRTAHLLDAISLGTWRAHANRDDYASGAR